MSKRSYKLFGDRVLLEKVSFKQGVIHTPDSGNSISHIGRVVAVADGTFRDGRKSVPIHVKVGDLVYFQTNAHMAASNAYQTSKDNVLINLAHGEIIAKVDSNALSLEGFTVISDWVLLKPFTRESESSIVVPEIAKDSFSVYYRVEQKGETVELPIEKGDEVLITQGYCHPVAIAGETYGFILKQGIHGVVEESRIIA